MILKPVIRERDGTYQQKGQYDCLSNISIRKRQVNLKKQCLDLSASSVMVKRLRWMLLVRLSYQWLTRIHGMCSLVKSRSISPKSKAKYSWVMYSWNQKTSLNSVPSSSAKIPRRRIKMRSKALIHQYLKLTTRESSRTKCPFISPLMCLMRTMRDSKTWRRESSSWSHRRWRCKGVRHKIYESGQCLKKKEQ